MIYFDNKVKNKNKLKEISGITKPSNSFEEIDGHIYYQNLCMKAVNQSIGRCIRHKNDFALAFLIDARFSQNVIQKNLSGWVKKKLINFDNLYDTDKFIKDFFFKHIK